MNFYMCGKLIMRLPQEFECAITIILKRLDVVGWHGFTHSGGLQQCCQGSALYFPHLDDLLVTINPKVCEVPPLHLLIVFKSLLLLIVFKFLLVVGR
jgi:hypothetical protein